MFGLGDSSYEQFNFIGKFINEGLEELGAERIYKYGEGNAEGARLRMTSTSGRPRSGLTSSITIKKTSKLNKGR